ncbi:MAG TPA: hypothetical protein VK569_03270, partial [Bacteroidota bacterium]|nr:hypothetical protein [Bacteroidota bacterium]
MKRHARKATARQTPPFTAFVAYAGSSVSEYTVAQLRASGLVRQVYLLTPASVRVPFKGSIPLRVKSPTAGSTMRMIASKTTTPYALLVLHDVAIQFGQFALERIASVAAQTGAGLIYADCMEVKGPSPAPHPLIDYQEGSIRDDFDFGSVVALERTSLARAAKEAAGYRHAGFYALRLAIARKEGIFRIAEPLYTKTEP